MTIKSSNPEAAPGMIHVVELNQFAPRPFVFTDLATALVDMFRSCGYGARRLTCGPVADHLADEIPQGDVALLVGWNVPWLGRHQAMLDRFRVALLNAEQLSSGSGLVDDAYLAFLANSIAVDYHASNVQFLRARFDSHMHLMPIIPSPSVLYGVARAPHQSADGVLFFGSMNPRRRDIVDALERAGVAVTVVAGSYGAELTDAILASKIILHVHFYETKLFPSIRFLQPVAARVPIVCESSMMSPHDDWSQSGIVFADYEEIVATCVSLLADPGRMKASAAACADHAATRDARPAVDALMLALGRAG